MGRSWPPWRPAPGKAPGRLPDPKARLVAQKVLEHGAPIPWKQIVAELGHRWTVGKARYAYARVCALCFAGEET